MQKLSPDLMKSAREHEDWVRAVINHEIKWLALRIILVIINLAFVVGIITLGILMLTTMMVVMQKIMDASVVFGAFVVGAILLMLISVKIALGEWSIVKYNDRVPLFIDKVDKKAEDKKDA